MIKNKEKRYTMKQKAEWMIMKRQTMQPEKMTTISMSHLRLQLQNKCIFIPDDVICEIMVKLPARSVGRFQCVCKSWLSITTNLSFIRAHTEHNRVVFPQRSLIMEGPGDRSKGYLASADASMDVSITIRKLPVLEKHQIIASCDGLLYVWSIEREYIVNPLTGYSIDLEDGIGELNRIMGFYFHHSTSRYCVLQALKYDVDGTAVLAVGDKFWRHVHCLPPAINQHVALDLKGNLYWLASKERMPDKQPTTIMTFDKESEVYNLLSLPPLEELRNLGGNLIDFNGELGLCVINNDNIIDVWIMEGHWVKIYSVNYFDVTGCSSNLGILPRAGWIIGAAFYIKEEKQLFIDHYISKVRHLIRWNLNSGACCYHQIGALPHYYYKSVPYMETLVYPDCSFI